MDEKNGHYDKWITPVLGCNDTVGEKKTKQYANQPPGNLPEFQPLDNKLNQDCHMAAETQVALTYHLPKDHPSKFSFSTPSEILKTYQRVIDPNYGGCIPSSDRILEDVERFIFSLKTIMKAKGKVVTGLSSREGHQRFVEHFADKEDLKKLKQMTMTTMTTMTTTMPVYLIPIRSTI